MNEYIIEHIKEIETRINKACEAYDRDSNDVKLLMATKTVSPEKILKAFETGHVLIAENRIQELRQKFEALNPARPNQHFIGHLQTNKIKELLRYNVTCLHSLDRPELGQKLQEHLEREEKTLEVLLQVNTSAEQSKFGVTPDEALSLAKSVAKLPNLKIKGLMTIGLFSAEDHKVEACFKRLKAVQSTLVSAQIPGVSMGELSMGMSGDLELAIKHGATIIRVGTAIFGKRDLPDSFYWNEQI